MNIKEVIELQKEALENQLPSQHSVDNDYSEIADKIEYLNNVGNYIDTFNDFLSEMEKLEILIEQADPHDGTLNYSDFSNKLELLKQALDILKEN